MFGMDPDIKKEVTNVLERVVEFIYTGAELNKIVHTAHDSGQSSSVKSVESPVSLNVLPDSFYREILLLMDTAYIQKSVNDSQFIRETYPLEITTEKRREIDCCFASISKDPLDATLRLLIGDKEHPIY
jgi:hypothetical protein